ncbi:MAG: hypothetical protein RI967_1338, partial [Planctomycetota bacterium]
MEMECATLGSSRGALQVEERAGVVVERVHLRSVPPIDSTDRFGARPAENAAGNAAQLDDAGSSCGACPRMGRGASDTRHAEWPTTSVLLEGATKPVRRMRRCSTIPAASRIARPAMRSLAPPSDHPSDGPQRSARSRLAQSPVRSPFGCDLEVVLQGASANEAFTERGLHRRRPSAEKGFQQTELPATRHGPPCRAARKMPQIVHRPSFALLARPRRPSR